MKLLSAAGSFELSVPGYGHSVEATALPNENYRLLIQLDQALRPSGHRYPDFPVQLN